MTDVDRIKDLDFVLRCDNFNLQALYGKRQYTKACNMIQQFNVSFCIGFSDKIYFVEGAVKQNGHTKYSNNLISSPTAFANDAWHEYIAVENCYQLNLMTLLYAQERHIKDANVDDIHDLILLGRALPKGYSAQCVESFKSVGYSGYLSFYFVHCDTESYFLGVDCYNRQNVGSYGGTK